MSKVLKGFVIAACVCIVIGIAILVGIGVSGNYKEVKNIMENGGIAISDSGIRVGNAELFDDDFEDTIKGGEESIYSAEEIEKIYMELEAGVFKIVEGDTNEIIIRSEEAIRIENDNDSISIETLDRIKVFGFWNADSQKVEITLPKGRQFHTIDLEVGAGELTADSLLAQNLTVELGAGRTEIGSFVCENAVISVGAGEVIIDNGMAEEMDLNVGMGDFQFAGEIIKELDADCGMGNMNLALSGEETDYNYAIDCGMGDVSVGNTSYGGMVSGKEIDNNASVNCDLDCGMGNISIVFTR